MQKKKTDVHIFVWRVCTSVFSFIPRGNEKNQQSILKLHLRGIITFVDVFTFKADTVHYRCLIGAFYLYSNATL